MQRRHGTDLAYSVSTGCRDVYEAYRGDEHPHRMRIVTERLHHSGQVVVNKRVAHDTIRPVVELIFGG